MHSLFPSDFLNKIYLDQAIYTDCLNYFVIVNS